MIRIEPDVKLLAGQILAQRTEWDLPEEWFEKLDHVGIKCLDAAHYDSEMELAKPYASLISEAEIGERRLGAVMLAPHSGIYEPKLGLVGWLEIMEPKPGAEQKVIGVEHAEFYYPDFTDLCAFLDETDLDYRTQPGEHHATVTVPVDDNGREVKFSNARLGAIVGDELREGTARVVYQRKPD